MVERASLSVVSRGRERHPFEGIEHLGFTMTLQRDEEVYQTGDAADRCWRVVSGCVRKVEVLDDGRRHVSAFLLPGDIFGFDEPDTYALNAEAVTTTTLRCY